MPNLDRGIVTWQGFPGAPGYSVFYATPGGSFMSSLRVFFDAIKGALGRNVVLSFPNTGDTIDSFTGNLVGSWSGATLSNVAAPTTGSYAAPVGCCILWNTGTIVPPGSSSLHSHKLRGKTFIVPLNSGSYDSDGSLEPVGMGGIAAAATALVSAGTDYWKVWHRPAPGGSDGVAGQVTGYTLHDRVAVLRSRRA